MITIKIIIPCWPSFEYAAQSCLRESLDALTKVDTGNFKFIICKSSHCYLSTARNSGIDNLNSARKTRLIKDCDYCLFIDADTGFTFDNIRALFDVQFPVIGGGYRYRIGDNKGNFVAGYWKKDKPGINETCIDKTETSIVKVDWIGAGFLLVRTDVFSLIEYPWFYYSLFDDGEEAYQIGEDINFCLKLKAAGIPILCHCGLNLIHKQD